ncbi:MAG: peptidoglycan editing factor PgeF [Deltaproteobacteria bacterium]|nr:peptidoglycan editing factor PgeF [Deltaproteobacteria bacterium]
MRSGHKLSDASGDLPGPGSIINSSLLSASGFRHAFFSRLGGVSLPPFESLNFSVTVGDDPDAVAENMARAADALRLQPDRLLFLNQVHGTACHLASRQDDAAAVRSSQGDAVLSPDPQVACCVRVADCGPLLIADRRSGWVAAVHSGWKGTLQNIAGAVIRKLRGHVGPDAELVAALGPHIEACCFEVGQDVADQLTAASPDKDIVRPGKRERPHVDLRRMIHAQLLEAGVAESNIDHVRGCTFCQPERFFSYRREGKRSGRHLAGIVARG